MRWRAPSTRRGNEEGFTFVEVLVGLVVISLLGVAAARGASQALGTLKRINARLQESAELLRIDDTMRTLCGRIRTPYWLASHELAVTPHRLHAGWLDGEQSRSLSFDFQDGVLTLGDGATLQRFPGLAEARFAPAEHGEQGVYGIGLDLLLPDGSQVRIIARLGGRPLGPGGGP